jgi:hypothetical protein
MVQQSDDEANVAVVGLFLPAILVRRARRPRTSSACGVCVWLPRTVFARDASDVRFFRCMEAVD